MTHFILRGLYKGFIALLLFLTAALSINGFNTYTATIQGQACVDTAVAKGWIKPVTYKPTMKITTGEQ